MSRRSRGWSGSVVVTARAYWGARIMLAAQRGEPLACYRCGREVLPSHEWDVDHVHARHLGGSVRDPNNQWPSHSACNRGSGAADTLAIKTTKAARLWSWT